MMATSIVVTKVLQWAKGNKLRHFNLAASSAQQQYYVSTLLQVGDSFLQNIPVVVGHFPPPQKLSYYHSTTPVALPVRRRRRPASSSLNNNKQSQINGDSSGSSADASNTSGEETKFMDSPLKHQGVADTTEFRKAAAELLTKIEVGLEPMKSKNDPFVLKRFDGDLGEVLTLDLGPTLGQYQIEVSDEEHVFEYSSPVSGKLLYVLSEATGEWVGQADGHNFEGLLVRDLIRYCQGMPNF